MKKSQGTQIRGHGNVVFKTNFFNCDVLQLADATTMRPTIKSKNRVCIVDICASLHVTGIVFSCKESLNTSKLEEVIEISNRKLAKRPFTSRRSAFASFFSCWKTLRRYCLWDDAQRVDKESSVPKQEEINCSPSSRKIRIAKFDECQKPHLSGARTKLSIVSMVFHLQLKLEV